jgi:pimeloyl-ACP methyl ester carboxylesterase
LIGLIDHFYYGGVYLVGHDGCAAIAWDVVINFTGRIKKLALLNVAHPSVMLELLRRSPRQRLRSWNTGFFQIPGLADWLKRLDHYWGAARLLSASGNHSTFKE